MHKCRYFMCNFTFPPEGRLVLPVTRWRCGDVAALGDEGEELVC